jgi:transposase
MSNPLEAVVTERIDDVALLLGFMLRARWPQLLNRHLKHHPNQLGLDLGWVLVIWLSYILSQGDHRKVNVQGWVEANRSTLEQLCGISLSGNDFNDDRLSILLRHLSQADVWGEIEREMATHSIEVYDLERRTVRHDATTANGQHLVSEDGLFQFGHSKDDPSRGQIKVMMSSLDPLGLPVRTQTVSGEQADDRLYLPAIIQTQDMLKQQGLLHVGDSKMSALEIRAHIEQSGDYYLCPLPMTGKTPEDMKRWRAEAQTQPEAVALIERTDAEGDCSVIGEGYELSRSLTYVANEQSIHWEERVLMVYAPTYAHQQIDGLETRLQNATEKILALTPLPGRGKRVFRELEPLQTKATAILKQFRLQHLLSVDYAPQGSTSKDQRYVITAVKRLEPELQAERDGYGWRPYVSNAPITQLSLPDAVLTYRDEWLVENGFRRLKGAQLSLTPLFVQRDDQVVGLLNLLSIALRLMTLMQFVVRQHLQQEGETLSGLYPDNPKKQTALPTVERLLKAFKGWSLTRLVFNGQPFVHAPPLSETQMRIIQALGLPHDLYSSLATNVENST